MIQVHPLVAISLELQKPKVKPKSNLFLSSILKCTPEKKSDQKQ